MAVFRKTLVPLGGGAALRTAAVSRTRSPRSRDVSPWMAAMIPAVAVFAVAVSLALIAHDAAARRGAADGPGASVSVEATPMQRSKTRLFCYLCDGGS